jgi:hypothetical protein
MFAMSAMPLAGQEAGGGHNQAVIFTVQDLSPGSETRDYQDPITTSISAAFRVGGYDLVSPDRWETEARRLSLDPRALLSEANALAVARAAGGDLALTGYYTVEGDRIYVSLQCWDVTAGVLAAGFQQTARFNLAFYSALHDQVAAMLPRIHVQQPSSVQASAGGGPASNLPVVDDLTFLSPDEGMELFLAGGARLGMIQNGRLEWQAAGLVPGSRFVVEKRKKGFHTGVQTVRAAKEIRLGGLVTEKTRAFEVDWTFGQLAGIGASLRAYSRPDAGFLFLANYFYVQPPLTSAGYSVFHYDISAGVGSYVILPPDSWVRLGVSTGAGSILTVTSGPANSSYGDVYWDVFNWWIETRVLGPVIFLRQEWKFTLGTGLLGMQLMNVANFPPVTLGVVFRW